MLNPIIPIGDYCGGLISVLNFFVFAGLLGLSLLIITIVDLIQLRRKKKKFDFIPLILTLGFGISFFVIFENKEHKFWTNQTLAGMVLKDGTPKSGALRLYENGSFAATYYHADYSCTFQGDYELNQNRLVLKRDDLVTQTDSLFATEYLLIRKDSMLKPTNENFEKIDIREIN